jgi:AcrR family transcriptional regulator
VRKRLDEERCGELLDGVMRIISARGFSDITVADLARELHCSASSLYKVAASKDSLIVLAISRWFDRALEDMEYRASGGATAVEKARIYWRTAAENIRQLSAAFRRDVERFDSTRLAYRAGSERFVDRFAALLDDAVKAGEIGPVNTRFLAHVLRQAAFVVRDERVMAECGLTSEQAMLELDQVIWDGIRTQGKAV